MSLSIEDRIAGCLLGGAIGDALGAGIEFISIGEIRGKFGPQGVTSYVPAYGRLGAITDDTQMTLFTAEGLIRASVRSRARGVCHTPSVVRQAYLRWLRTQGVASRAGGDEAGEWDGWLVGVKDLHHQRAPGNTCLSALLDGGDGSVDRPINTSKGCGGVMRTAPAGFPAWSSEERFEMGCELAAISHGHPDGYLPAGFLAVAVGSLIDGRPLDAALDEAELALRSADQSSGTLTAVREGRELGSRGLPTPQDLERLGGGWVGEEALAIGIACAAAGADLRSSLLASVNHSGDSDSTGAITGNLLGAAHGAAALPPDWLEPLELRGVIEQIAADAALEFRGDPPSDDWGAPTDEWFARYPGV